MSKTPARKKEAGKKESGEKEPAKKVSLKKEPAKKEPAKKEPVKKVAKKEVPREEEVPENNSPDDPIEEGLKLIQSRPEGVLQSELWKELGVDSRKCSRIVKKLEESGLIERVEFKKEGLKTYLLKAKQMPVNPSDLLAGDELIPCIGCDLECVIEECHPLMDWMYQLAIVSHSED